MTDRTSRLLAAAGSMLLAAFIGGPGTSGALVAALPLLLGGVALFARLHYAPIGAAILMLPYFCYGVMLALTQPEARVTAAGFTVLTIAVFFAAIDVVRRQRVASATGLDH